MTLSFTGLSAFPLTPADAEGVVDVDALGRLVDRIARSAPDSIGLLGSTGIYAYLDRTERKRAVVAAVEAAGRVPVIVGVGALRSSRACDLARDAEAAGAAGLLLAPMSYTPLTQDEAEHHYRAVSGATGLPLCVYNNPGTTGFRFPPDLIGRLAALPRIAAIKMPLPADGDFAGELRTLRPLVPDSFAIGYSGDWGAAPALLAGGAAWYSVVAGLLPGPALRLTRAAQAGQADAAAALDAAFAPLWSLFRAHGSLRVMYVVAERLGLSVGDPPLPLRRPDASVAQEVEAALERLAVL
ncbi:dihydrodipicolinate synthase family protein [Aquabacter cavernae]|uniref:dihydrodipicolinate synthase family protein n=1 Tax=Aquabacter cavernae TaxID=2496029 RepID=UPI000F8D4B8E|nr:dihydrodipicolinate synthase family protein [Aquabacter cavernae]